MSKGPTDAALNYTPAEAEVYHAGYLTAMEHSTSIDDARHLYDVLYQEHGRLTHKQPRTRRTRRTTEAERLDMVSRWRRGEDFAAIAKHYGLAKVTVYTHIKKRVTDAERAQIEAGPAPMKVVTPCPEDEASVARQSQHRRAREKCATCDQLKADYLRDWHKANPDKNATYKRTQRARLRFER